MTDQISSLSAYFTNLVTSLMEIERQPLVALQKQRDSVNIQRAVYVDLKSKLDVLRTSVKSLISTDPFYSISPGRSASVSNAPTGTTVLSASATTGAVAGTYAVAVTSLATAQRKVSGVQTSMDRPLGKTGTLYLGGSGSASNAVQVEANGSGVLTGAQTAAITGSELATGNYTIETRQNGSDLEYRIMNGDSSVADWTVAASTSVDTGRGLQFTLTGTAGSATVFYAATPGASESGTSGLLNSVSQGSIATGLKELGTGAYTMETQTNNGKEQFRLKDSSGTVISIANSSGDLVSGWVDVPDNPTTTAYDTGRGLVLTFSGNNAGANATLNYVAKGTTVSVEAADTLVTIANKINDASQPEGRDVSATVVGNQLVLSSTTTGTTHSMIFGDGLGLTISQNQAAGNAVFSVNNINLTRQTNTGLTDVISGVTLNLEDDAVDSSGVGRSAKVVVSNDNTAARQTVDSFITNFNDLQTYLNAKTSITKDSETSYSRGPLADDNSFVDLRYTLFSKFMEPVAGAGTFSSLSDIGLTMDDNMAVSVSDSAKLEDALKNHASDLKALFDGVMGGINAVLGRFTGTDGYLSSAVTTLDSNLSDMGTDITEMTNRLTDRQSTLSTQYGQMQAQLISLSYTQQIWQSVYSTASKYS